MVEATKPCITIQAREGGEFRGREGNLGHLRLDGADIFYIDPNFSVEREGEQRDTVAVAQIEANRGKSSRSLRSCWSLGDEFGLAEGIDDEKQAIGRLLEICAENPAHVAVRDGKAKAVALEMKAMEAA